MTRRLDIDALLALCAIADHGGVTRAANHLALSQSAVSHKIKRLETSIECNLLTRRPGAPLFTADGNRLLNYARRILSLHDEALLSLGKQPLSGKIRLGMTEDTTSSDLSRILGRFIRLHPNVSVRTHVAQSLTLESELGCGKIDLSVMQIFKHNLLPTDILLFEDRLHWVKALDVPLNFERPIPFLAFDNNCFYKHWVMDVSQSKAPGFETILECASTAGIVSAVQSGLGVSLLNERHLTLQMQIIDDLFPLPPDIAYIIRVNRKSRSQAVRSLVYEIASETGQNNAFRIA